MAIGQYELMIINKYLLDYPVDSFEELIPEGKYVNLDELLGGDFSKIPESIKEKYIAKLKCIPFSSLGKQNGMLIGIRADNIMIKKKKKKEKKENIIIGIYNKSLTKRGEYRALIGIEGF